MDIADLVPENDKDVFPKPSLQFQNGVYIGLLNMSLNITYEGGNKFGKN